MDFDYLACVCCEQGWLHLCRAYSTCNRSIGKDILDISTLIVNEVGTNDLYLSFDVCRLLVRFHTKKSTEGDCLIGVNDQTAFTVRRRRFDDCQFLDESLMRSVSFWTRTPEMRRVVLTGSSMPV